jgi:hypothetical protein
MLLMELHVASVQFHHIPEDIHFLSQFLTVLLDSGAWDEKEG